MSFFRRLSRDRSSKGEQDLQMPIRAKPYSDDNQGSLYKDTQYPSSPTSQDKLQSYRASAPQDHLYNSSQRPPGTSSDATTHTAPTTMAPAPDPLTKAFNDAIRPYMEKIENLQNELDDVTLNVQQLEDERADMHAWIDKRGLRAGKGPSFHPSHPSQSRVRSLPESSLTSSSYRCPTPHRRRNEYRPFISPDPELPHRPQNDRPKRRPPPPPRQPNNAPPHLNLRNDPPHSPPLYRIPLHPPRRRLPRLRTNHKTRRQPELPRRRRRLEQRRRPNLAREFLRSPRRRHGGCHPSAVEPSFWRGAPMGGGKGCEAS